MVGSSTPRSPDLVHRDGRSCTQIRCCSPCPDEVFCPTLRLIRAPYSASSSARSPGFGVLGIELIKLGMLCWSSSASTESSGHAPCRAGRQMFAKVHWDSPFSLDHYRSSLKVTQPLGQATSKQRRSLKYPERFLTTHPAPSFATSIRPETDLEVGDLMCTYLGCRNPPQLCEVRFPAHRSPTTDSLNTLAGPVVGGSKIERFLKAEGLVPCLQDLRSWRCLCKKVGFRGMVIRPLWYMQPDFSGFRFLIPGFAD